MYSSYTIYVFFIYIYLLYLGFENKKQILYTDFTHNEEIFLSCAHYQVYYVKNMTSLFERWLKRKTRIQRFFYVYFKLNTVLAK